MHPSIGTVGDAYVNALMESVIGLFKTELIRTTIFHHGPYRNAADVEWATAGWVDWWNNRRLHSSLENQTPKSSSTSSTRLSTENCDPYRSGTEPGCFTGMTGRTTPR